MEIKADVIPPKSNNFLDEYGQECTHEVIYEWLPSQCPKKKTFERSCEEKTAQDKYEESIRYSTAATINQQKSKLKWPKYFKETARTQRG